MDEPDDQAGAAAPSVEYDQRYFDTALGPVPYDRSHAQWLDFFKTIADRIAVLIEPRRVLDVGCAKGFLVEALRDHGVEAFGIDISAYAIGEVREDIKPHCRVASAVEPLADPYELITCIEVLEHMSEAEARRAIANLCAATRDILFSSTPDDLTEPTHVTVRPRSWWIERFAERGFNLDAAFDARFIAAHAMRFRAGANAAPAVDALLLHRHQLLQEIDALRHEVEGQGEILREGEGVLDDLRRQHARLLGDLEAVQRGAQAMRNDFMVVRTALASARDDAEALHRDAEASDRLIADLGAHLQARDADIAACNYHLLSMQRTIGWKVLERLRRIRDGLCPRDSRRWDLYWRIRRPIEVLLEEGVRAFFFKARYKIRLKWRRQEALVKSPARERPPDTLDAQYQLWLQRRRLGPADLAGMNAAIARFAYSPLISIATPVYNTDEVWLRKCVESVQAQTYPFWELCLVNDGSTTLDVKGILDAYAATDSRVKVEHLSHNQGIVGASTAALQLATGDFVALLDHDDELAPEALFEVTRLLNADPDVDLIYSDEDKLEVDGRRVEPFFKPDWSPDLLRSMNYITHLAVFRRALVAEIGGFRRGFEGSQDYDLLLRVTDRTHRIAHIPKVLYHWRKIPGSAAASAAAKPYAYEAGRRALEDSLARRGWEGDVEILRPGSYTIRYRVRDTPLVSIIIPTRDRWSLLWPCLRSIAEKTAHPRYEIIILDNDSTETETLRGLDAVAGECRVVKYPGPFNFSAINNFGAAQARGDYIVFLNNDTQVVAPDWLGAMLEFAQRADVGAVGARLHYPDGHIQHGGVVLGIGGVADHAFRGLPDDAYSYFGLAGVVRNVSAVTAACLMMRRQTFEEVHGFDERLVVALNDVDLCLRLRQRGYLIVYAPRAHLFHHESGSRGRLHPPADDELVWRLWSDVIRNGDPYYNINLTTSRTDWSLRV